MQVQRHYALDAEAARRLIAEHGWAAIVTCGHAGPRATYGYFLLEDNAGDDVVVLGHFARADPQASDIAERRPAALLFNGPHGYISASWYSPDITREPSTWNHISVHLHGTPEPLDAEAGFEVLRRTLAFHERSERTPWRLEGDAEAYARRIAPATMPFRLRARTVEAKAKLSQNKPQVVIDRVIERLEEGGPHANAALAAVMRAHSRPR